MSKKQEKSVTERSQGSILIRDCKLPNKGDVIEGHTHKYDHTMFFMSGKAKVTCHTNQGIGEEFEIEAPADMFIDKNIRHEITALTNNVFFCCVFPHRDMTGNVTEKPTVRDAYV